MTDSDEKITYSLDVSEWAHPAGRGPVETSLARMSTPDPAVAAATLRAIADQLDPPRPAYRYGGDGAGALIERCRGDACNEGHAYTAGCLLANVADRYQDGRDSTMGPPAVPLRDADGPNYAHDAHCNTIHEAGPDECPPARDEPYEIPGTILGSGGATVEVGTWTRNSGPDATLNGVEITVAGRYGTPRAVRLTPRRARTVAELINAAADKVVADCRAANLEVDAPGDRMDAPDAVLTADAAEAVARVAQDEETALMARMRQGGHGRGQGPLMSTRRERRPGRTVETALDRAAKNDGCGSEHTHTGSCAYTVAERINPDA